MFAADPLAPTALRFENVTFSHGERQLFGGLSFALEAGQILWIIGDNGIGKTSILKLALGLLKPESGKISYERGGASTTARSCVGYVSHKDAFEPLLTVRETLAFWRDVFETDPETEQDIDEILSQFGLSGQALQRTHSLSAGQKRRLALARMHIGNRAIWIMDEPKAAMDQTGQALIDSLLRAHVQRGGSALIASHYGPAAIGKNTRKLILEAPQ